MTGIENNLRKGTSEDRDILSFVSNIMAMTVSYLDDRNAPECTIYPQVDFSELKQLLSIQPQTDQANSPQQDHETLLATCHAILQGSIRSSHPNFLSQLYGRSDLYGVAGEIIVAALNTNVHIFELSSAFSIIESETIRWVTRQFGLETKSAREGRAAQPDGLFVPGGSFANFLALHIARHQASPNQCNSGMSMGPQYAIYASEAAHYSIKKSAMYTGLGIDNVLSVNCDQDGRMCHKHLEHLVQTTMSDGHTPLFVCATAGTTVLGAFDPLDEISNIANRYNLWMHVDAAWGGGAAFSVKHRWRLSGINNADSISFNAHKMLGAPIQCSMLLTNAKWAGLLEKANSIDAPYLYQDNRIGHDNDMNYSKKSLQCGRRGDAFKLWLMQRAHGDDGLAKKINNSAELAELLAAKVRERGNVNGAFHLYSINFTTVCFWYIPKTVRHPSLNAIQIRDVHFEQIDNLAPKIRNHFIHSNSNIMVGHCKINNMPNFFRMAIINPAISDIDIFPNFDQILDEIERCGDLLSK